MLVFFFFFFFFFQAEDGIRDDLVTGVQTCALPIYPAYGARPLRRTIQRLLQDPLALEILEGAILPGDHVRVDRSEERRVGKECRCRWSPYDYKKKKEEWKERRGTSISV